MRKLGLRLALIFAFISIFALAACEKKPLFTDSTPTPGSSSGATPTENPDYGGEIDATPTVPVAPSGMPTYTPTPTSGVIEVLPTGTSKTETGIDPTGVPGVEPTGSIVNPDENPIDKAIEVKVKALTKNDYVKVTLVPYIGLKLKAASSDDIDAAVAKKLSTIKEEVYITDAAQLGDYVNVTYYANVIDDSGEYEIAYSEDGISSRLGSGEMILGFEPTIVGNRAGDAVSYTYTFDPNYPDERYAGKTAVFYITINYVYRIVTPELTDETAASYFGYSSAAEFVRAVLHETNRARYESQIWDYFNNNVWADDIPSSEIDEYSDFLFNKYYSYAEANAYKYDGNIEKSIASLFDGNYKNADELKTYLRAIAKQRIQNMYIMKAIAQNNEVTLSEDDYMIRMDKYIVSQDSGEDGVPFEYNDYEIEYGVYTDLVMEYIISKAITE